MVDEQNDLQIMVNELLEEKRMMQELVRSLSPTADTPRSEQPEQPEQPETSIEDNVDVLSCITHHPQSSILATVENTIVKEVNEKTASLIETIKSSSNEDLINRIVSLEKQIRLASIEESRRMYSVLKEQQIAFENDVKIEE